MKILLFCMTGFGNSVAKALLKTNSEIVALFTRKENMAFPCYEEENIAELVQKESIPIYKRSDLENKEIIDLISKISPDLILVTTYHKIIPDRIINIPKLSSVNLHASLLPEYCGATPTN